MIQRAQSVFDSTAVTALLLIAVPNLLLTACGGGDNDISNIVATWRDGAVTRDELDGWLEFRREDDDSEIRTAQVEDMLLVATLADAAGARGDDPATVIRIRDTENRILMAALRRHTADSVAISDDEVEAILDDNPGAFSKPRRVRLRNIFKRIPEGASEVEIDALRQRMEELRNEVRAGADFGELATRESDSQSRFRKGLVGTVPAGRMRPEFDEIAMALAPGELSPIIDTEDGFTLLWCDQVFEASAPTRAEALEMIAGNMRRLRSREQWKRLEAELLEYANPEIDQAVIDDPAAPPDAVVARFFGGEVRRGELEALTASRPGARGSGAQASAHARAALDGYILTAAAAARAGELGLDDDPEIVARMLWSGRQILAAEELRRRVEAQLAVPSEKEIRAYFDDNRGVFQKKERYRLAVIRIDAEEAELRGAVRRAAALADDLRAGRQGFAEAARAHSDHPSAQQGGALGWLERRQVAGFGLELMRTITGQTPGEISEVVQVGTSLWIVKLEEIEAARLLEFNEAAPAAERRLGTERARELQRGIEDDLRRQLDVVVVEETRT